MPVDDISFHNIQFEAETGMLIKNATNIDLHNIRVNTKQKPALIAENVIGLQIDAVRTLRPLPGVPLISLSGVQNAFIYNHSPNAGTDAFLELKNGTKEVVLKGNNFRNVKQPVIKAREVAEVIAIE